MKRSLRKDSTVYETYHDKRPVEADRIEVLGVPIGALSVSILHQRIESSVTQDSHVLFLHANVNALNLAYEQPWLHLFLNEADLVYCDGFGVILGGRLHGQRIPERITLADWIWELTAFAERMDYSMFFLGARPGVAAKAACLLHQKYPDLPIVDTHHGYFDKDPNSKENLDVIGQINQVRPDILIVGFGTPLQERWLKENWDQIDARVTIAGGAVFDYVSGNLPRSPRWLNKHGLEWLGRLIIEPHRLWRRYLIGNPKFLWRLLKEGGRKFAQQYWGREKTEGEFAK